MLIAYDYHARAAATGPNRARRQEGLQDQADCRVKFHRSDPTVDSSAGKGV